MRALLRRCDRQGRRATGKTLLELGDLNSAADQVIRRYPELADGRFIRGATAAYSGKAATADLDLAARDGYYFAPLAPFVEAQADAENAKDYKAALPLYEQLADAYPGNALFHFDVAWTLQALSLSDESLASYCEVIANLHVTPPASALLCKTYFAEGQILESQGKWGQAIAQYENALGRAESCNVATAWYVPWSHYQLGRCLEKEGKHDLALAQLDCVSKDADADAYRRAQSLAGDIRSGEAHAPE